MTIALPWQHLPGKDMRDYRRDARQRKIPIIAVLDAQDVRDFFEVCSTHQRTILCSICKLQVNSQGINCMQQREAIISRTFILPQVHRKGKITDTWTV